MKIIKFFGKLGISLSLLDAIIILNIIFITLYVWRSYPLTTLRADSYQYLIGILWVKYFRPPMTLMDYTTGATLMGMVLGNILGARVDLYYWAALYILVAINILIYIMLLKITKRRIVAFGGSIIMAASYFGIFGMCVQGIYANMMERVVALIFLIPSFILLHLFLENGKKKYLAYSVAMFLFSTVLWHWGTTLIVLFFFYPVLKGLYEDSFKKIYKYILIGLPYLIITGTIEYLQNMYIPEFGPKGYTLTEFILNPGKYQYLSDMLRQLVYFNSYPLLLNGLKYSFVQGRIFDPYGLISDLPSIRKLTVPVLVFYTLLTAYTYKVLPKVRPFFVTVVLTFVSLLFLNCFLQRYIPSTQAGSHRYLHMPAVIFAFYWAIALWAVFWRHKSAIVKFLGLGFLGFYVWVNTLLIDSNFEHLFAWDHSAGIVINYVSKMNTAGMENTLIVGPYPEFQPYESYFFSQYKKGKNIRFVDNYSFFEDELTWKDIAPAYDHLIMLEYNKDCGCVLEKKVR